MDNKCTAAREERDLMWNRIRRHGGEGAYNRYKTARNKYTKIRREAEVEYQRDKCIDEPKLFHDYIKSKIKKLRTKLSAWQIKERRVCVLLPFRHASPVMPPHLSLPLSTSCNHASLATILLVKVIVDLKKVRDVFRFGVGRSLS